jgi:fluoride exporter
MKKIFYETLCVGLGGFLGAILRYCSNSLVSKLINTEQFPYGTFLVNITGCFCIGVVFGISRYIFQLDNHLKLFVLVGILGSYTTFSTFAYETLQLMENGKIISPFLNVFMQVTIGITAVWIGILLTKNIKLFF